MKLTEYEIYRSMFEFDFFDEAVSCIKPINLERAFKSAGDKEINSIPGKRKEAYIKRKMDWYLRLAKKFGEKDISKIGYFLTGILVSLIEDSTLEIVDKSDPVEILTDLIPQLLENELYDLALTASGIVSVLYADELDGEEQFVVQFTEVFRSRDVSRLEQLVNSMGAESLFDKFETVLADFKDDFNGLHVELIKAASALKKEKMLPNSELNENIIRLRDKFHKFTQIVLDTHEDLSGTKIEVKGLNDLVAAVEEIKSLKDTYGLNAYSGETDHLFRLKLSTGSDVNCPVVGA